MEFCRQQCKRTEMENSWGANFQCNYQQMGIQKACITLKWMKLHMARNIFSIYELTILLTLSILFVGKVKITQFNGLIFYGSRPFLCGTPSSHHKSRRSTPVLVLLPDTNTTYDIQYDSMIDVSIQNYIQSSVEYSYSIRIWYNILQVPPKNCLEPII